MFSQESTHLLEFNFILGCKLYFPLFQNHYPTFKIYHTQNQMKMKLKWAAHASPHVNYMKITLNGLLWRTVNAQDFAG